jgi:hypothetical protein
MQPRNCMRDSKNFPFFSFFKRNPFFFLLSEKFRNIQNFPPDATAETRYTIQTCTSFPTHAQKKLCLLRDEPAVSQYLSRLVMAGSQDRHWHPCIAKCSADS